MHIQHTLDQTIEEFTWASFPQVESIYKQLTKTDFSWNWF